MRVNCCIYFLKQLFISQSKKFNSWIDASLGVLCHTSQDLASFRVTVFRLCNIFMNIFMNVCLTHFKLIHHVHSDKYSAEVIVHAQIRKTSEELTMSLIIICPWWLIHHPRISSFLKVSLKNSLKHLEFGSIGNTRPTCIRIFSQLTEIGLWLN